VKFAERFFELNKSKILKLILIGVIVILIGNAIAISRDYQDSWILEGLEIPFVLFVVTYALAFFSEKSALSLVALAVIGRAVFLLIPNLKYVWFQGTAIDQNQQYALANYVYNQGYIATQGPSLVFFYIRSPLIHLTFATFSIVSSIPVVESVKYIPVLLSPIFPLLTYVIVKNLFPRETPMLKYALFISSIPITVEKYAVTGSQFGVLLMFFILTSIVMLLQKNDRRHWSVFVFFTLVLPIAHSVSSLLTAMLLLAIMLFQKIPYSRLKPYLRPSVALLAIVSCTAWLTFSATSALENLVDVIVRGVVMGVSPAPVENLPSRFFELAHVSILEAAKVLLALNGGEILLLLLTIGGFVILLRMRRQLNDTSRYFLLISFLMLAFIPIGVLIKVGVFRALHFVSPLFPIFSSIFILHLTKRRIWLRAVILSSIVLLVILQLYRCQPLIPSANVLSKDLPANEPIVYASQVNSIYQRRMIEFAEHYSIGQIACDDVTRSQIIGLTDLNFSATRLAWYYPLDKHQLEKKYDYFLIHLPGASGRIDEQAEIRTRDLILGAIYNSSIIYTNGESYVLAHTPTQP
jgi:hypothetical protein